MSLPAGFVPGRVVVVRPRGLGDIVLSTAVLDALRRAWPEARLDYLTERSARALLECDERLDGLFLLRGDRGPARSANGPTVAGGSRWDAIAWLRARRADLLVDLFSNPHTALLTAASGVPWRVGLDKRLRRFAYNVRVPRFRSLPEEDHRWARDVQLDMLRAAGVRWEGEAEARAPVLPSDRTAAAAALASLGYGPDDGFAAVLPGGSWATKRWTVEAFAHVGRVLAERLGQPTLVVWGPPEREDATAIAAALGDRGRLAPPTTLRGMAALLARPRLLVSTDCLGRHFAIVQGTPTVGVFGPTDPRDWTPPRGPHRTVSAPEGAPLAALRAAPVAEAATSLLAAPAPDDLGRAFPGTPE